MGNQVTALLLLGVLGGTLSRQMGGGPGTIAFGILGISLVGLIAYAFVVSRT